MFATHRSNIVRLSGRRKKKNKKKKEKKKRKIRRKNLGRNYKTSHPTDGMPNDTTKAFNDFQTKTIDPESRVTLASSMHESL